ncbi:uncharacterized protein LOC135349901 isoform X2 [Halichondria panicea]|uniref:uncharacterized protein LOC135349901 isoform X2 n=1 Tax=Halichondria panicea TaxID=6063 RepID=UPI00312BBFE3
MSCNSTSDTETGLPGGNFESKFSLYSTDTEEQVASVNRGLDRCAALLKTLLTPDKDGGQAEEDSQDNQDNCNGGDKGKENHPPNALSSKLTTLKTTGQSSAKTVHSEGQKHTHPHACSTPLRPPPVPRALNDPVNQLPTDRTTQDTTGQPVIKVDNQQQEGGRVVTFGQQKEIGKRRTKRAHRRLQTEPRKPFVVSRNPPKTRPQIEVRTRPSRHHPTHTATGGKPGASVKHSTLTKMSPSVTTTHHHNNTETPPKYSYPLYAPLPYLSYIPYPPTSSSPHPPSALSATSKIGPPPPWLSCFPLLNGWISNGNKLTTSTPTTSVSNGPVMFVPVPIQQGTLEEPTNNVHPATTIMQSSSSAATSKTIARTDTHSVLPSTVGGEQRRCSSAPLTRPPAESVHGVREMEKCLMMEIANIEQGLASTGHSELTSCLDRLKSCVPEQCRQLENPLPTLSSHWMRQTEQLEQEKAQLLQRVIQSEYAYSEAMGQLELATKERSSFHDLVETHRRQLVVLREDLHSAKEALTLIDSQHSLTKEGHSEERRLVELHYRELEDEHKELKEKAAHLETELSTVRKGSLGFPGRLSEVQCSIERAQEELDMIRVTIAEKDTQLLHAHDQLLGLRQCFAHVLAGLKPVDICKSCDHTHLSRDNGYEISSQLVDKLQSLVNDGNVERFLLETSRSGTHDNTAGGDSNNCSDTNSILPEAELDLTLTESQTEEPHEFNSPPRGPASVSSASNPVITPLNLSSELHPLSPPTSEASTLTMSHFNHLLPPSSMNTNSLRTDSPLSSSVGARGQLDTQSCLTTSSEMEFKTDLASLDADIARLQIQFRVALKKSS